jgi:hypothetical protein
MTKEELLQFVNQYQRYFNVDDLQDLEPLEILKKFTHRCYEYGHEKGDRRGYREGFDAGYKELESRVLDLFNH